jgi:hypothetical protein
MELLEVEAKIKEILTFFLWDIISWNIIFPGVL